MIPDSNGDLYKGTASMAVQTREPAGPPSTTVTKNPAKARLVCARVDVYPDNGAESSQMKRKRGQETVPSKVKNAKLLPRSGSPRRAAHRVS